MHRAPPGAPRSGALRGASVAWALTATLLAIGCGNKGPPRPPIRYVPLPATDLRAVQQGDQLLIAWSYPTVTTGGQALPGIESVEIWMRQLTLPAPDAPPVAMTPQAFAAGAELLYRAESEALGAATVGPELRFRAPSPPVTFAEAGESLLLLASRTISATGEYSAYSNVAQVPLVEPPPAPREAQAQPTAAGIELTWTLDTQSVDGTRIYRRGVDEPEFGLPIGKVAGAGTTYTDGSAALGNEYVYELRSVHPERPPVESAASAELVVDYRDTFPPEPPGGLLALPERRQVRLVWDAVAESGVGYVVYRRDPRGQDFRRLNEEPATRPDYVDAGLVSGLTYTYRVSAIDASGNESTASDEVAATVP